jgi:hypothetical protein
LTGGLQGSNLDVRGRDTSQSAPEQAPEVAGREERRCDVTRRVTGGATAPSPGSHLLALARRPHASSNHLLLGNSSHSLQRSLWILAPLLSASDAHQVRGDRQPGERGHCVPASRSSHNEARTSTARPALLYLLPDQSDANRRVDHQVRRRWRRGVGKVRLASYVRVIRLPGLRRQASYCLSLPCADGRPDGCSIATTWPSQLETALLPPACSTPPVRTPSSSRLCVGH